MKTPTLTPADWGRIRNALRIRANEEADWRLRNPGGWIPGDVETFERREKAYRKTLEKVKGVGK